MRTRSRIVLAAAAGLSLAVTTGAGGASASAPSSALHGLRVIKTLSSSYAGPLQFAIHGRTVLVADSFTATLNRIGSSTPLATGPDAGSGGDIAGVDFTSSAIAYTSSSADHSVTTLTILRKGHKTVVADLAGFEKKRNPDGAIHYGVSDPATVTQACSDELAKAEVPVSYSGQVDSHPYAVAALGNGAWAVADAGGNDLLKVDSRGRVSVISVLPAQRVTISAASATANGIPDCGGVTYAFESVPTDVEVASHGGLWATTLPGGPEGPDSGNPGSLYRIDRHGHPSRVATGFASATNLAVDSRGRVFVAELGSGTIAVVGHGAGRTVATLPGVVGVEWSSGHLYASTAPGATGGDGPGTIVELG
ncbi:ScyD/ScyE family protein [uncultured Amnibacterium sp.]|uniref:ScyD/ScyE family protein n=1 Tax=uncultured Amnibacterium sp. TaxID=1631851 RepID=UPI0035CADE7A